MFIETAQRYTDVVCAYDALCRKVKSWDITDVKDGESVTCLMSTRRSAVPIIQQKLILVLKTLIGNRALNFVT